MKITNEQLRIMQAEELRKAQQPGRPSEEFAELFARRLEQGQTQSAFSPAGVLPMPGQGAVQLPKTEALQELPSSTDAAARMDGMFTSFERYAEQIAQGQTGGLREAYSLLEGISQQIAGFKADYPDAGEQMPEMATLLNELDVLTTTESFKFNRGDYL